MASRSLLRSVVRDRVVLFLIVAAVAATAWLAFRDTSTRPLRLKLSAGRPQGPRHAMAETLAAQSKARGVTITVVPTAGSEESLDRLEKGQIDVAMVQGGLSFEGRSHVRLVAALHVEPLHLLVKKELEIEAMKGLDALRGHSVNVGEVGSGTRPLALAVMRFARLEPDADYRATAMTYDQLESAPAAARDTLPDAVFMVSLLPSRVARRLVSRHDYRLVALPFSEAFTLDGLSADLSPAPPAREKIERDEVNESAIPAFTYGVRPAVPPEPIVTLGTRMLLVAREDVDAESVARLLDATFTTSFAHLAHPPLTPKVLELPVALPPHPGMLLYQERSKPLITGDVIDSVEKEISIAGAVIGASFFLWQWLKSRYRQRRESRFEDYILRVAEVERQSLALELGVTLDLPGLLALQEELARIKSEAISKFAEGEIDGEALMSGFLAHASDARDHLTRLILHRRDDLERQARKQKRQAADLWREAVAEPSPPGDTSSDHPHLVESDHLTG